MKPRAPGLMVVRAKASIASGTLNHFREQIGDRHAYKGDLAVDLLADLIHWHNVNGLDFDSALATARQHAAAEENERP